MWYVIDIYFKEKRINHSEILEKIEIFDHMSEPSKSNVKIHVMNKNKIV